MAAKHFISWVERQAQTMRRRLFLPPLAPLNPYKLAAKMHAQIFLPADIPGMSTADLTQLLQTDPDAWSAGSIRLPNGEVAIALNSTHHENRKRATLMEELSHVHLNHTPSQLILIDGGPAVRSFKKTQETEAYWVGSAALLPSAALQDARSKAINRDTLRGIYTVSLALIGFRERVTGIKLR